MAVVPSVVARSLFTIALVLGVSPTLAAKDCQTLYEARLREDLSLPLETFDGNDDRGWRALEQSGCKHQAVTLIQAYMNHYRSSPVTLRWRLAQLHADLGETDEAIGQARTVLMDPRRDSTSKLRWNDYVLALIAYWQKDRNVFELHKAELAKHLDHPGNVHNLALLEKLQWPPSP